MRRSYLIAGTGCGLFSATCFLVFWSTPGTLDEQGVLHEPFGLLPLGWFFGLMGVLLGCLAVVRGK